MPKDNNTDIDTYHQKHFQGQFFKWVIWNFVGTNNASAMYTIINQRKRTTQMPGSF